MSAIVVCERCGTKYRVKYSDIPDGGRRVRCVSCGHDWFQAPLFESDGDEPVDDAVNENQGAEPGRMEGEQEGDAKVSREEAAQEEIEDPEEEPEEEPEEAPEEGQAPQRVPIAPVTGLRKRPKQVQKAAGSKAQKKDEKSSSGKSAGASLFLSALSAINVLILVVLAFGASRDDIPVWAEPLYGFFGIYDSYLLEFDNASVAKDDSGALLLTADIVNNFPQTKRLPLVRLKFIDDMGNTLSVEYLKIGRSQFIAGDGRYSLKKRVQSIPRDASKLVLDIGNSIEMMMS